MRGYALIACAICALACAFLLAQPNLAQATENVGGTVPQNVPADQNGNDPVTNLAATSTNNTVNVMSTDNATATSSDTTTGNATTDKDKNETTTTTPPAQTETPKEDLDKYLKDAKGNVITGAGWHSLAGKWYYTKANGELLKDFQTIKNNKYYLDPTSGVMLAGWQSISNNKYYFGAANDGAMKKGWQKLGGIWYYLDSGTGILQTGFKNVSGKTYYLDGDKNGAMKAGWAQIVKDGKTNWYYFGGANDGAMRKGWQKLGAWYYLDPSTGAMASDFTKVGNKTYYLGGANDGSMKSGWQKIAKDGKTDWYYFGGANDGSMKTGWQKLGAWYYLDLSTGAMKSGLNTINGKRYYLGGANDGSMKSGWIELTENGEKNWYYFNGQNDGSAKAGWVSSNGVWYYLDPSTGIMVTKTKKTDAGGTLRLNGTLYAFADSGAMLSNTRYTFNDGSIGYAAPSGAISKIGVLDDNKSLILKPNDATLTGWQKIGGTWFYANNSGVVQTGWRKEGSTWYYLQPSSGAMATGSCKVDGVMNYFEGNGAWNAEKTNMVKRAQGFSSRTGYLILVDVNACRVGVFNGSQGNWNLIRYEACVCGAPGSPTIRGTYATGYHLGNLPAWPNALYCTNITGGYFFHSVLSSTSELGGHLSHGCIRLNWPTAQYMQSLPYGSTVNLY